MMWYPYYKKKEKKYTSFVFGALYGMVLFVVLYGFKILNVTYDGWLLSGGDLSQHYIGWCCYRLSDWQFPIGLMEGLNYPGLSSIIYTDSIPHFAVIFKLLSPFLPETFQYFGLYGLFSYAMMGGFSAQLLRVYTGSLSLSIILSTLFIYSPYILQRMYNHTSLAGQWIIVAAFYLWLCKPLQNRKYLNAAIWFALLYVAAGIHIYFIPMVLIVCFMNCIEDMIKKESGLFAGFRMLSAVSGALVCCFQYGAFYGKVQKNTEGLGLFSSNLNTIFDPQQTSFFLKNLQHGAKQGEGYGYLGLGVLMIVFAAVFYCVCMKHEVICEEAAEVTKHQGFLLAIISVMYAAAAISPQIMLGKRILAELPVPEIIYNLWSIFRASGRFIWGFCYIIMFISIWIIFNVMDSSKFRKWVVALLVIIIQLVDLSPRLEEIHYTERYRYYIEHESGMSEDAWRHLLKEKKHIIYQPYDAFPYNNIRIDTALLALKEKADVNSFYFARSDTEAMTKWNDLIYEELEDGKVRDDVVYVFAEGNLCVLNYELCYYRLDDVIIGIDRKNIELEKNQRVQKYMTDHILKIPLSQYFVSMESTEDNENQRRAVMVTGCLYGPYSEILQGKYRITFYGENLESAIPKIVDYSYCQDEFPYEVLERDSTHIVISCTIPSDLENLETILYNGGESPLYVKEVAIMPD